MTRAVIVTNIPTPYRLPVYEQVREHLDLRVVYLAEREPDRDWVVPPLGPWATTLRSRTIRIGSRYVHVTRGLWRVLDRLAPEVVVTTGFNPPHLAAFLWCRVHRVPHVAQTDGTVESERTLTVLHRLVRRVVARRSVAFVAASRSGRVLMERWGAPKPRIFISPLAVDNSAFASVRREDRDIDVVFASRLAPVKNPLFVLDVAESAARVLGRPLRVAVIGDGPLRDQIAVRARAAGELLEVLQPGFVQQDELPSWFARGRVFLFPTVWDPWGLVVNEAAAAGLAQVVSPDAGSVQEMLQDEVSALVRRIDRDEWTAALVRLLEDPALAERLAGEASRRVAAYTFLAAAEGLEAAIALAAQASTRSARS